MAIKKLSTQSKGKIAEQEFFTMLVKKGFSVFTPYVDDSGIDALVRLSENKYASIQIKSREPDAKYSDKFAAIKYTKGRRNFWFAFRTYKNDKPTWWLLSGKEFEKIAKQESKGTWGITLKEDDPVYNRYILDKNRWNIFIK